MKYYAGITIGPIVDTLSLSSTPGALWFASYFFSTLTRKLTLQLQKDMTEEKIRIFTLPKESDIETSYQEGIGIYHDRIYFSVECESDKQALRTQMKSMIRKVIVGSDTDCVASKSMADELIAVFGTEKALAIREFLLDYLRVHYVIFTEQEVAGGLARTLADALDALEAANQITYHREANYIQTLMQGTLHGGNNEYLRKFIANGECDNHTGICKEAKKAEEANAKKNIRIKKLIEIASGKDVSDDALIPNLAKTEKYFAIVQADGDFMGKIVAAEGGTLTEQENRIELFSKLCADYAKSAVKRITDFGGAVIYAGGDDLLFLTPIFTTKQEDSSISNVWELCRVIAQDFRVESEKWMRDNGIRIENGKTPSISFGVSINYHKFPLDEAMNDARGLLFGEAKNYQNKNNLAIKIHKASGQSQGCVVCLETNNPGQDSTIYAKLEEVLSAVYGGGQDTDYLLHSITYSIENKKALFDCLMQEITSKTDEAATLLCNMISGIFTSDRTIDKSYTKEKKEEQNKALQDLAVAVAIEDKAKDLSDNVKYTKATALTNMLRMAKFLVEENVDGE